MPSNINLQRNSKVFYSVASIEGGDVLSNITPANTWELEVLAGFAATATSATQDITLQESGLTPNRSRRTFATAMNPVDWNLQTYIRPTGATANGYHLINFTNTSSTGNVKPLADWYMWQALVSNTPPAIGTSERSVWRNNGVLRTNTSVTGNVGVSDSTTNFSAATTGHLYLRLDNVYYQVCNTVVNQATLDASIDSIATTTWSGMGSHMVQLVGTKHNIATAVFGGITTTGTSVTANANAMAFSRIGSYHPYDRMNVAATETTAEYIKNKLSTLVVTHANAAGGTSYQYTFPLTSYSLTYNNNINFITPEELSKKNQPIAQFVGSRDVSGSATVYLRGGPSESAQFLRNVLVDSRIDSSTTANIRVNIGGTVKPFVQVDMPVVQFEAPQLGMDDIISMTINYKAQEIPNLADGGEIELDVSTI